MQQHQHDTTLHHPPQPTATQPARKPAGCKAWLTALCALLAAGLIAGGAVLYGIWHSGYVSVHNSYFTSPFVTGCNALVLVAHQDDEVNLAYGVIDTLTAAGSKVTVAYATNGDAQLSADVRMAEARNAEALMGVPAEDIVFLGYGDCMTKPPFFLGDATQVRTSPAGHSQTCAPTGYTAFHNARFGVSAAYTPANLQQDIYQLLVDLQPDLILVMDTDYHVDHASLSQLFDRAMGVLLHAQQAYRPTVLKGFAYDYAWHGNDDFYVDPLQSAAPQWVSYSYNACYPWAERVRLPMPNAYLSYTLRSSKLYRVLGCFESQPALVKARNLLNGDKIYWERRTDACYGTVTASSGDAALLNDFVLGGYAKDTLAGCWQPDATDAAPAVHMAWAAPQAIQTLVLYQAPQPAGTVPGVAVRINGGQPQRFALTADAGMPDRLPIGRTDVTSIDIVLEATGGAPGGLFEVEALPPRSQTLAWVKLMDPAGNFAYELPCPAMQALALPVYGYPMVPETLSVSLWQGGKELPAPVWDGQAVQLPPLPAGQYRLRIESGACQDEVLLRVGDTMLWQNVLQWAEQKLDQVLPG